ncbi:hypothetical protein V2W45_1234396, partial [Cenococcum geophilum]
PNLFVSAEQASQFTATLWSLFGAGTFERGYLRPLGQIRIISYITHWVGLMCLSRVCGRGVRKGCSLESWRRS